MLDRLLPIGAAQEAKSSIAWADAPDDVAALLRGYEDAAAPLRPIGSSGPRRLQAGYYFRDARLLLAGGPAVADLARGQIGVDVRAATDWLARHRPIVLDRRETPLAAGIGGRVAEDATGPVLRHTMSAGQPGFTDANGEAFGGAPGPAAVPRRLPDAIVLHGDDVPRRITLTLEPTTACNFDCGFCYGRHLPIGLLRYKQVEKLLDNMPEVAAVEITGEGEPLVNKDVFKIIALFKQRGIWVHLTTNGSRLDDAMIGRILDSGVDRVATSLESVRPDRHERLRPGSDFAAFRDGLRRLRRESDGRPQNLEMYLWISLLRECADELDAMFAFADEIGFDCVEMQALNAMQPYARVYDQAMRRNLMSLVELKALRDDPALGPRARQGMTDLVSLYDGGRCAIFDSAAMVYWQGRMTPCRLLKLPDVPVMGSLVDTPFETLWQGDDFRRFRFALRHGMVLDCCTGCPYVHAAETAAPRRELASLP